jgi:hypothetical protein
MEAVYPLDFETAFFCRSSLKKARQQGSARKPVVEQRFHVRESRLAGCVTGSVINLC